MDSLLRLHQTFVGSIEVKAYSLHVFVERFDSFIIMTGPSQSAQRIPREFLLLGIWDFFVVGRETELALIEFKIKQPAPFSF
jgi:hypothetical protein